MSDKIKEYENRFYSRFNLPKYQEFNEDYNFLCDVLTKQARQIEESAGIKLAVETRNEQLRLSDELALKNWYMQVIERSKREMINRYSREWRFSVPTDASFVEVFELIGVEQPQLFENEAKLLAWNKAKGFFFEWVVLTSLLKRYIKPDGNQTELIMGSGRGPARIFLGGEVRYLWFQKSIIAKHSGLSARPDMLLTKDHRTPSANNIIGLFECKAVATIHSKVIREIFGTACDIALPFFALLASYVAVPQSKRNGARSLGVTIMANPLSGLERQGYLKKELDMFEDIYLEIEKIEREKPFLKRLIELRDLVYSKL